MGDAAGLPNKNNTGPCARARLRCPPRQLSAFLPAPQNHAPEYLTHQGVVLVALLDDEPHFFILC